MKFINESEEELCVVCLIEQPDPEREDDMCSLCGQVADRYNTDDLYLLED